MTQLFRALVVLAENLGSISTFRLATYVPGDPMPLLVSIDTRNTWYTQTGMQAKHPHTFKKVGQLD